MLKYQIQIKIIIHFFFISKMSNSPDHIESFFNFLDVDSYLDLSLKGYELGDESLF